MLETETRTNGSAVHNFFSKTMSAAPFRPLVIANIYFFFYLAMSTWLPFFNIYLLDSGYTGAQIGLITGVYQAMLFFVVPIWGVIADRFGNRSTLHIALFGALVLLWFLRSIPTYHILMIYMIGFAFIQHPNGTLIDSLAVTYVRSSQRLSFGHLRVWGSLSWSMGTLIMGRILQSQDTSLIFRVAPIIYGATWIILWLYSKPEEAQRIRVAFSLSELKAIFANKRIVFFLVLLSLLGVGLSPLYIFINLYYRDIGASNQLIGLGFSLIALSEVPIFFIGGRFVKKFGTQHVFLFAVFVAVLRLALFSIISNPVLAVFMGLAQGLTYSLFWIVVVEIIHDMVPPQWRATAQSLIWAFHIGIGITVGNIAIGWLSDFIAMQQVMLLASVFTLLVFIGIVFYFRSFYKSTAV
jgi:MFS family permease